MTHARRIEEEARQPNHEWDTNRRWTDVERPYFAEEFIRLRGSVRGRGL